MKPTLDSVSNVDSSSETDVTFINGRMKYNHMFQRSKQAIYSKRKVQDKIPKKIENKFLEKGCSPLRMRVLKR